MNWLEMIALGWLGAALVMGALWLHQLRTGVVGTVDVAWAWLTGVLGVGFIVFGADGVFAREVLVAVLGFVWAARLALHLGRRLAHEREDSRYRFLRDWLGPARVAPFMFGFFQLQASWAVLFALPMLIAANNPAPPGALDVCAVLLWCAAVLGEAAADRQLARFKADPANRGQVCRQGWWRYSRHPNYFFEWLHWWAYVAFAFAAPYWWLTLLCVAIMLVFLLFFTGVPYSEQQSLRSRGQAYRDYQRTTSMFLPLPPRRG